MNRSSTGEASPANPLCHIPAEPLCHRAEHFTLVPPGTPTATCSSGTEQEVLLDHSVHLFSHASCTSQVQLWGWCIFRGSKVENLCCQHWESIKELWSAGKPPGLPTEVLSPTEGARLMEELSFTS